MMNEKRVNEIISQITAFSKDTYTRSEYLPELLKLQKELIDLTFNAEHAENGDLRLWDVERHLRKMNEERGHVADDELARFVEGSKVVCNNISAEFSGNAGEQKPDFRQSFKRTRYRYRLRPNKERKPRRGGWA